MDKMWGEHTVKLRAEDAKRGQLFDEGNYAMFIHWGLYSLLANEVDGKTYYGIGEWIMSPRRADIPPEEYKKLAGQFNPTNFDAKAIAALAKAAGMKYIVITSKHHDGFAMYDSKANDFNIVDATPYAKDPMKELAEACREQGLGFGFYYSHNQDWTYPGGNAGPEKDAKGNRKTFDDYFKEKCLPQVEEITSQYGPIELVWFDTPGDMPKEYVEQLVAVVRKNQPNALVSGRAGHGLGDYNTLGDMEVPHANVEGMWESVDTTNDSWAYAWYDEYWKSPEEILKRLIACVARGGTYMLNIGPRGDGSVPERAIRILRESGEWIQKYPQVVYATDASPWQHGLPWGDATVKDNRIYLSVFEWPRSGRLFLPGLKSEIISARMLKGSDSKEISFSKRRGWTMLKLPLRAPEKLISVIELELDGAPEVDPTFALDPEIGTEILAEFAEVEGATKEKFRWMEKFGEWKSVKRVHEWEEGGTASFEVDVLVPGEYNVDLTYAGKGRLVWKVAVEGGEWIQNEQNSSHNYQEFPIGWINFPKPGRYTVSVSSVEGDRKSASLKAIRFTPVF
ncbi:alpha-L-fucosidase [Pelagicoccus sp. SDUM812005]|uniref:alpha-L-fucosidase n=1 Tax=Pelagicoccus sp. SDUM812005 TaxID=3041257 RepID=UPI0031BAFBE1